jgi:hypothetical protein
MQGELSAFVRPVRSEPTSRDEEMTATEAEGFIQLNAHPGAWKRKVLQLLVPQLEGNSITLLRATGHPTWECKGEKE